jgi:hypothetical protein
MRSISASVSVVKRGQSRENAQQAPQLRQIDASVDVETTSMPGARPGSGPGDGRSRSGGLA